MGQSHGSMTATSAAANDPEGHSGLIATGAGSYGLGITLFFPGSFGGINVSELIETRYMNVPKGTVSEDLFHPIWALSELALSPANTSIQAANWL